MNEAEFYALADAVAGIKPPEELGRQYFPSVEDLEDALAQATPEDLAPLLLWLASDPYKDGLDNPYLVADYKKAVRMAKKLTAEIPLDNGLPSFS